MGKSTSGQGEVHALLKATTPGCAIVALCNTNAMRTSLVLCPSSSMHACMFVYAEEAEQGCCQDLLVSTYSLHTVLGQLHVVLTCLPYNMLH